MKTLFRLIPVVLFLAVLGCGVGDNINFPSSNPIGPPPEEPIAGRQTSTTWSGQLATAPSGTQIRDNSNESWETASALQPIPEYGETRNTLTNDYDVDLYADAMMEYENLATVNLKDVSGAVYYKNSDGNWAHVDDNGDYYTTAIATGSNGSVTIVCSLKGAFPPPPPPDTLEK